MPIPAIQAKPRLHLAVLSLFGREMLRFVRQRNRVLGSVGTPLLFWLLLGSGFGNSMRPVGLAQGMDYGTFFFPGTIMLVVLFTAIFSSMSVILERREGFLQGVLVAPVPRIAIVLGKVLGGTAIGLIQGLLLLLLAPLAGLPLSPLAFAHAAFVIAITGLGLSALGFFFAWGMDSVQGFHAVMNLVLMPMWLLSGAFFPAAGAAPWLRAIMAANPLAYGTTALRGAMQPGQPTSLAGLDSSAALAVTVAFAVAMLLLAAWRVSRPERG